MGFMKRNLAMVLAMLLMLPAQPALAENTRIQKAEEESEQIQKAASSEKKELPDEYPKATPNNAVKVIETGDEVKFNTGNHVWSVVSYEDFQENKVGDAYFEEDGNYTINIPEENPFFPYEVQFTYKGKTVNKWFMTPDDSVTVGGHTFYVSAYFDNTAVTQMSLEIAGDTVAVYPEKKEFTDEGEGTSEASLLPLEERKLTVDLRGYTPVELTMVSIDSIFTGNQIMLNDTDKVIWSYEDTRDYQVSPSDGFINLSWDTHYKDAVTWEMIVGDDNQLAADNIRYLVTVNVTKCSDWLIPTAYRTDFEGNRKKIEIERSQYTVKYDGLYPWLAIEIPPLDEYAEGYIGLELNTSLFNNTHYDHLKAYSGQNVQTVEQALLLEQEGTLSSYDWTDKVFLKNMEETDAGVTDFHLALVAYDSSDRIIGFQIMNMDLVERRKGAYPYELYTETGVNRTNLQLIDNYQMTQETDWPHEEWIYEDNPGDEGCLVFNYHSFNDDWSVIAAYEGRYHSIEEAEAAGKEDIKDILFDQSAGGGYKADYSDGVSFSVFVGLSRTDIREWYYHTVRSRTKGIVTDKPLTFTGLKDKNGNDISCYVADDEEDSYAENSYLTILTEEGTDLTRLAPVFVSGKGMKVYSSGGSSPEKSGESFHDFSNGPVQYTVSAENGAESKNYWLQVVKIVRGQGKLYVNSLAAKDAETEYHKDGMVDSVREMIMNEQNGYEHDILLMNTGTDPISGLKAELESGQIELDSYWTLDGRYELKGADTVSKKAGIEYGELPNMAKLRLKVKGGIADGEEIAGTLKLKSGEQTLVVLTLTGMVGNPDITDWTVADGVKYVPYGTMIQNNNKYSWNRPTYQIIGGVLPDGMELKPNGELYGVPTESGEFSFTVAMENSHTGFAMRTREFVLIIAENTDANVDAATDVGYELTRRIPDIASDSTEDYIMVSQGEYEEFVALFLDGEKLTEGTDYTSEAGSTRITIRNQTLKRSNTPGVHTLGIEFRTKDNRILKRAAQNFRITSEADSGNTGNNGGNGNESDTGNTSGSNGNGNGEESSSDSRKQNESSDGGTSQIYKDPKKGYVHMVTGIISGSKSGYSRWQQDEKGWKLIYADGTAASGYMTTLENGENVEQIAWEKINNSWYAFGADGYLKSGWVYDYRLGRWYSLSVDTGMAGGWYTDPVDNNTYYLDPADGSLSVGWRNIDLKWYYFNHVVTEPSWVLNKETGNWQYNTKTKSRPLGALLRSEETPDGYRVNADGVWDGKGRQ